MGATLGILLTLGSVDSVTDGTELTTTDGRVEGDSVGLVETGAIVGLVEIGAVDGFVEAGAIVGNVVGLIETGAIVGLAGCWVGIAIGVSTTDGLSVAMSTSSSAPI